jgi:hypothetical protein
MWGVIEGEREVMVQVLHVGDGQPMACLSDEDTAHVRFPCPGSLTGGSRSAFEEWREPEPVFGLHSS